MAFRALHRFYHSPEAGQMCHPEGIEPPMPGTLEAENHWHHPLKAPKASELEPGIPQTIKVWRFEAASPWSLGISNTMIPGTAETLSLELESSRRSSLEPAGAKRNLGSTLARTLLLVCPLA